MSQTTPTLYLVDGSSYLYRAYHALPPLTNSHGEPTGAVFGVASMIRKLLLDNKPEYIAVIFDAKGKNFRHELYEEYKSHRPPMPDDLRVQIEPLHRLIQAMGIPLISISGVEADDVIATFAKQAEQQNWHTHISTIDKDMMQLVNSHIKIYNDMTKTMYDEAGVLKKFGVPSHMIVDYLALIGDKSDNVPGVPGVGPKTAIKWLNDYGSLENIIANRSQIKNKAGISLCNSVDFLPMSKQLVTLKTDVALEYTLSDLKKKPTAHQPLITLLETLGFRSWLNDELKNGPAPQANGLSTANAKHAEQNCSSQDKTADYNLIVNNSELDNLLNIITESQYFCFDVKTNNLGDPHNINTTITGLAIESNSKSYYIPLAHKDNETKNISSNQLEPDYVLSKFKDYFNSAYVTKISQNIKHQKNILARYNITVAEPYHDVSLESYVYNSTANKHDVDTLFFRIFNNLKTSYEDVAGKGAKQINFDEVDLNVAGKYSCEDIAALHQVHNHFHSALKQDPKLLKVYNDIEIPLVNILSEMECAGVLIDAELLTVQSKEIEITLEQLSNNIFKTSGEVFNIDSPKQLQEVLYQKLNLPVFEKTPTGQPSTSESVLQDLALDFPIVTDILRYRGLSKLTSTYTYSLPLQINPSTGRIHTCFQQAITATGRLSSTNPNLQNIPIKTSEGRRIRQAFIAPKDHVLISCDYSQIELRIMAHLSKDQNLLNAFNKDQDIHNFTAAEIFKINPNDVTNEHRRYAKAINFGLIYGMSAFGLAKQLSIDNTSAQQYIELYFTRYPGVKKYMDDTKQLAKNQGYVETLFGRRLYLPEINSKNVMRRKAIERVAINAPMQGTAADIIKLAMINVDKALTQQKLHNHAKLILQVHDELILEVHQDYIDPAKALMVDAMQSAAKLDVPLKVSSNVGKNWDEAH